MKSFVKKIIIPIIFAIILGYICGKTINNIYMEKQEKKLNENLVYVIEGKTYNNLGELKKSNLDKNYAYYRDGKKYKIIVGITKSEKNISKIKKEYNSKTTINQFMLDNTKQNSILKKYDKKLSKSKNELENKTNINKILKFYQENNIILQKAS